MKIHHLLLLSIVAAFGVAGCDTNDGPAEEMGEALDDTGEDIEDAAKEACEDAKEGVDADDTDC
jgi:predicted small secreted protein